MKQDVIDILNKCGIIFEKEEELSEFSIPRDIFLSMDRYKKVEPELEKIKKLGFSSSSLTSLQKNAQINQKWPLLNLTRQILKANGYSMKPFRQARGSTPEGKKKYIRFFKIQKMHKGETI